MKPIAHIEVPQLALWKACVAEILARHAGDLGNAAGVDATHPIMQATDRYCRKMQENLPIDPPLRHDELAVHEYLSYLHHHRVHAQIGDDPQRRTALDHEVHEYRSGTPLWQQIATAYFAYYWQYPFHLAKQPQYRSWQSPDWGAGDLQYGVIPWRLPATARVVIVGDIGTGTDVGTAVLRAALAFRPDVILHLGGVYYAGTEFETKHRLVGLARSVLHTQHTRVPFFTVPGNHEYFTGAGPFFHALDTHALASAPDQRQPASYFCLRSEDNGWQFLGVDTGYHGHYLNVPAAGQQAVLERLHGGKLPAPTPTTDPHWPAHRHPFFRHTAGPHVPHDPDAPEQVFLRSDEVTWHLDKLAQFAGRSILLSHHQLYSALDACGVAQRHRAGPDGTAELDPADFNRRWINTQLWRQLGPAFGDRVAAWIWGHEHNLEIFQDNYRPRDWPDTDEARAVFKTLPKGRCAGHGAFPVAESEEPYVQKFPLALVRPDAKLGVTDGWYNHGFQLLELAGAGHPARLSYFQVAGADPTPLPIYVEPVI